MDAGAGKKTAPVLFFSILPAERVFHPPPSSSTVLNPIPVVQNSALFSVSRLKMKL